MKTEKDWTRLSRAKHEFLDWFGKEPADSVEESQALQLHDVEAAPSDAHDSGKSADSEG